jgi:serine/threonine-protein kinase
VTLRDGEPAPGTDAHREPARGLAPGAILDGRYRLHELIGEGGMGRVYEGEHLGLRRKVAIKVLTAQGGLDEQLVLRFEREAMALAAVAHRNVVAVTDYGIHEATQPYLVMELLEGRSLSELLAVEDVLPVGRAAALMRQILAGLGHAHAQGLVHRDLKPGNVWIEPHPEGELAKLLDFGFAKPVSPDAGAMLTADGIVVGTLAYMSPEQAAGGAVDHRSDLYSAGVLFFEMLTGHRPFGGEPIEILRAHITLEPPTLAAARPDLGFSPEIEAIVRRALAKAPGARFESAQELADAISQAAGDELPGERWSDAGPRPSRPSDEEAKTLVYDDTKTLVDGEAKTVLLDASALAREPRASTEERGAGAARPVRREDASAIELRTQELAALKVPEAAAKTPAASPSRGLGEAERGARAPRAIQILALAALGVLGLGALVFVARDAAPARDGDGTRGASLTAATSPRGAAHDPIDVWALYPPDAQLERYRRRVERGAVLSRTTVRELRLLEREHPGDPRVNLVIAQAFMNSEWFRDALEVFAEAYAKDARVAESAGFLEALVALAREKVTSDGAAELLLELYGPRALPAVHAALDEAADDPAGAARLAALARRLERPAD